MADVIFLSASVPDPKRAPKYAATADSVAITTAVSAFVHVVLGRRILVWGGHPAITPMIWNIAQEMSIDYGRWIRLYQSRFFQDEFPEDNERFQNVTYTTGISGDRERSLLLMREAMFSENAFTAGVFIGGMAGIVSEFELFRQLQPKAVVVPIVSTGGAVLEVAERLGGITPDLEDDLDYVALLHRHLGISVREERYRQPEDQPAEVEQRYWKHPSS
ncbi:hypothetical protein IQ273_15445 [Nodosilinea sp. LEGE 07298]|uniref:SLOG domain-containing protein n=1 Tax=Nodosilinea sp. LEGE 07298 TaxID=2777970 RepID=UPI00187E9026|nr:hypothetical protein [Nodosilinea sp. LEGE 07298]MBE9110808.1 hypothetical protein [Nodosilinea sp. LEGE 07298]